MVLGGIRKNDTLLLYNTYLGVPKSLVLSLHNLMFFNL